ncbi:MAG: aldo/keto reductase [Verrucomicrobiae bacterium]|nr:aldo/keto reductase [Verrucomicrobiae bacterium]
MIRKIIMPGTNISVSRLSFGTASLHHLWSSRERQDLLAVAAESGISHFDTSPYYGYGLAEQELGAFLRITRSKITVATKIGLYPPRWGGRKVWTIWASKLSGRVLPILSRPIVDWSVKRAALSLDQSLRRLAIERVDFLLLHEPHAALMQSDEILSWLLREQRQGKIGAWGLAGNVHDMHDWISTGHSLAQVLQVKDSLQGRQADKLRVYERQFQFSFGYLSSRAAMSAGDALRAALRRNLSGSVIVSSRSRQRIAELAAAGRE